MNQIADSLVKIKNALKIGKKQVELPDIKMVRAIVGILKETSFISDFTAEDGTILVDLLYNRGESVIADIEMISTGGQRMYVGWKEITPVKSGRGVGIISTSQGVMSADEARKKKVGGEYICKIW